MKGFLTLLALPLLVSMAACASGGGSSCGGSGDAITLATLRPQGFIDRGGPISVTSGNKLPLEVRRDGVVVTTGLTWSATRGSVDGAGVYTAPPTMGEDHVEVRLDNGWRMGLWLKVVEAAKIFYFGATPDHVAPGVPTVLMYTCTPGCSVRIQEGGKEGPTVLSEYQTRGAGSVTVSLKTTTSYRLEVTNSAGTVEVQECTVTVTGGVS